MTSDLASMDLDYHGEGYRNMLSTTAVHWKERYESGLLSYTDQTTFGYDAWRSIRGCDLIIPSTKGGWSLSNHSTKASYAF